MRQVLGVIFLSSFCVVQFSLVLSSKNEAPIIINVTNNNQSSGSSAANAKVAVKQKVVKHVFSIKYPDNPFPSMRCVFDKMQRMDSALRSYLWESKWHIVATLAAMGYGAMWYTLYQANQMLAQSDSWCLWKDITPLAHLATTKGEDLLQQLAFDIHKKYYELTYTSSSQIIYKQFLHDVHLELHYLKMYRFLYNICYFSCIRKILPFKYSDEILNERKARLQFVIDLFVKLQLLK